MIDTDDTQVSSIGVEERSKYVIGVDLGQANDPTAIAVLQVVHKLYGLVADRPI